VIERSLLDTRVPAIKRVNGANVTPAGGPYGLFSAEAYLILTPDPVLVDCGGPPTYPQLRDNLAVLGVVPANIRLVIATHFHEDHVGNLLALRQDAPQVSFAIHQADAVAFIERRAPSGDPTQPGMARSHPDLARVDIPLTDGQRLHYGRASFEVLHTPGHTDGSAAILVEIDGVRAIFVGDTVHGLYFPHPGGDVYADLQEWARSLERLAVCPFDFMFEGHVLPVHVLGNPAALSDSDKANFYNLLEYRMADRRRGIETAEAKRIIAAQQAVTASQLLITPETWIFELAAQKASELGWEL